MENWFILVDFVAALEIIYEFPKVSAFAVIRVTAHDS